MSERLTYRIECEIEPEGFYHLANLYTAVCELEREGLASVALRATRRRRASDPSTAILKVTRFAGGGTLRVAFEMSDSSGVFNMEALEESDIYFKRSYHA